MIPPIFKDKVQQKLFEENGFIKLPLLSEKDINQLTQLFYKFHPIIYENSFGASSFLQNKEKKMKIIDALFPIFEPYFNEIFIDFEYFGSSFLFKSKGKKSDVCPHQDWTIVDENKFIALNIWTPLVDTSPENGTLFVVPKSQAQKLFVLRAPTIPFYFQNYFDSVLKCGIPTNAKAGEAVILNQSLIHYSTPNSTEKIRVAITSGVKSKNAPMLFHFMEKSGTIIQYKMPEDFLLDFGDFEHDIYNIPTNGTRIGEIPYIAPLISKRQFLQQFGKKSGTFFGKLMERLR